jgi:CRP-like cAMP-binding protein
MTTPWARLFGYKEEQMPEKVRIIDLLSRVPIFEELNSRELQAIDRILHRREYVQDEFIFRQGEPGMGMYIVQKGAVSIVSEPENQELFEMGDGDFFGEVALLDQGPRSATAIARTTSVIFGFFQPDLLELIERNPRLGLKILLRVARHVGERLRRANKRVLALTLELETLRQSKSHEG